ncbi:60S ribosomal protein L18a-like protein [Neltuma alba]|uniref:60S ribosomal protein L18a-like protein n=1 Tax=Neltuma alba TaxID=207710 RepID=UPI0010A45A76|nr:60S ribosomal protein L18a-like protein [Prosopis alba]
MSEEGKNRGVVTDHPRQPYYGTFQGVANYYPAAPPPPPQPQPVVGFPQPIPPPATYGAHYYQGYQTVPGYAVAEGRPIREHRLPCCGLGLGWFLFITGFFLGGIPWYVGTILLLCVQMDYREKPGLVACTVASIIAVIAVTLGVTNKGHDW